MSADVHQWKQHYKRCIGREVKYSSARPSKNQGGEDGIGKLRDKNRKKRKLGEFEKEKPDAAADDEVGGQWGEGSGGNEGSGGDEGPKTDFLAKYIPPRVQPRLDFVTWHAGGPSSCMKVFLGHRQVHRKGRNGLGVVDGVEQLVLHLVGLVRGICDLAVGRKAGRSK